jgi:hypothetical protein
MQYCREWFRLLDLYAKAVADHHALAAKLVDITSVPPPGRPGVREDETQNTRSVLRRL